MLIGETQLITEIRIERKVQLVARLWCARKKEKTAFAVLHQARKKL